MKESELRHLINGIAQEVISADEAKNVVRVLAEIDDWDSYIEKAKRQYTKREIGRVANALRRAKDKDLPYTLTTEAWLQTVADFHGRCAYCQEPFSYEHLEHFHPLAGNKFGTTVDNCVPSCKRCNRFKNTKDINYWLSQQALFENSFEADFGKNMQRVHIYLQSRAGKTRPKVFPLQARG